MATKPFKVYDPHNKAYSSRRTNDEWEQHRPLLTRLHNKHRPRREMIAQLSSRGFNVTQSQLTSQLKKWNLTIENRNIAPGWSEGQETSWTSTDMQGDEVSDDNSQPIFNSLPPPRTISPQSNQSNSRPREASPNGSINSTVVRSKEHSPQSLPSKAPSLNGTSITNLSPETSRSDTPESTTSLRQQTPTPSYNQRLRRKQGIQNFVYQDLAEALLEGIDIDLDWSTVPTEQNGGSDREVSGLFSPDIYSTDYDFLQKHSPMNVSDYEPPNERSNTTIVPAVVDQKAHQFASPRSIENLERSSPAASEHSSHLFPDFESVFGDRFSNINPSPKVKPAEVKTVAPERKERSSPKLYSLKLADRVAKNSPTWDTTFPSLASAGSIIRNLSTIVEPWCKSFPTSCSCQNLFFVREGFMTSPELYKILLEQSPIESLRYIMALLNLAEVQGIDSSSEVLKGRLREALEFYVKLCTRVDFKNNTASMILHRLLKVSEKILDGERTATKPLSTRSLSSTSLRTSALLEKLFEGSPSDRPPRSDNEEGVDWFKECADNAIKLDFAGLGPSTFSALNKSGRNFGMRPWAFNYSAPSIDEYEEEKESTTEYPSPVFDGIFLTTTAAHVATMLEHQHKSTPVPGVASIEASDCDRIFSALGLMIALEFSTNVSFLYEAPGTISDPAYWTSQMTHFVYTFIESLGQNADCADKFRKAYWLARTTKISRDGKGIHTGSCKATKEWAILERSIYEFDEERPWIERKFLANRLLLPHDKELVVGDRMSIHSASSANSYDQFQQTAVRLQVGRMPSHRSARSWKTSSSNRMSVESHLSQQLERVLGIHDGDAMSLTETAEDE